MLPGISFGNYPFSAKYPYSLGEADLTPCLIEGHLDPDQENQNVECPWPMVGSELDHDRNRANDFYWNQ